MRAQQWDAEETATGREAPTGSGYAPHHVPVGLRAGITQNLSFAQPLCCCTFRNDVFGESVTIGTQVAGGARNDLGHPRAGGDGVYPDSGPGRRFRHVRSRVERPLLDPGIGLAPREMSHGYRKN